VTVVQPSEKSAITAVAAAVGAVTAGAVTVAVTAVQAVTAVRRRKAGVVAVSVLLVGASLFKGLADRLVQSAVFRHGFGLAEGTGMIEVGLGIGQKALSQGADTHEEIPLGSPRLVLRLKETPQGLGGIGRSVSGKQIAGNTLGGGSGRRGKGRYDG
jgi:hypothetical protein